MRGPRVVVPCIYYIVIRLDKTDIDGRVTVYIYINDDTKETCVTTIILY